MTRSELIERLRAAMDDVPGGTAERLAHVVFAAIADRLVAGGRVELRDFGIFTTRARDARVGRNPRSGESVPVSAKRAIHFKPGRALAERLKSGGGD